MNYIPVDNMDSFDALYFGRKRRKRKEVFQLNLLWDNIMEESLSLHTSGSLLLYKMSACRFSLKIDFNEGHEYWTISIKQPPAWGKSSKLTKCGLQWNCSWRGILVSQALVRYSLTHQFYMEIYPKVIIIDYVQRFIEMYVFSSIFK